MRGSDDSHVFSFAQKKKAVLFSADLGFSNTLTFPLGKHCGICILRFPNEVSVQLVNSEVRKLLSKLAVGDYLGNLVILSPGKLRLRRSKKQRN